MRRALAFAASLLAAAPAAANPVGFDGWTEQRFSLFSSNDFAADGDALSVRSDGTVSLLWTALPAAYAPARNAAWSWAVDASVPATDLTARGGDDRNLALYFLFLPEAEAAAARDKSIKALLEAENARVLMYVWGGDYAAGQILPTPYLGDRGRTVAMRKAGDGAARERVDLAADLARAFGEDPGALVGLAVSADSDDTDARIVARIEGLTVE
ncbi:DUF3047 domain-containing protein [Rhodovulum sp. DZ06]|uniref:DUF3047 domain-containing protein n=1 Tax=Rhodovulum sp. DZ06 TaxID=3425126 RepID=UPI003D33E91E